VPREESYAASLVFGSLDGRSRGPAHRPRRSGPLLRFIPSSDVTVLGSGQSGAEIVLDPTDWETIARYPNRYTGMSPRRDIDAYDGMPLTLKLATVAVEAVTATD